MRIIDSNMFFRKKNTPTSDIYFKFAIDRYNSLLPKPLTKTETQRIRYRLIYPNLFETSTALILIRTLDRKSYEYVKQSNKKLIYIVDDNFEEIIKSDKILYFYRNRIREFYEQYHNFIVSRANEIVCCSENIARIYNGKNVVILNPYWACEPCLLDASIPQQINSIAWLGTRSHLPDLEIIAEELKPVFLQNKTLRFHVFLRREHVPLWLKGFPGLFLHKPLKWNKYYKLLPGLKLDICLYPLEQNQVSESRSINKVIEHCYANAVGIYPKWFVEYKNLPLPEIFTVDINSWSDKIHWLLSNDNYAESYMKHQKIAYELNENNYMEQMEYWLNNS